MIAQTFWQMNQPTALEVQGQAIVDAILAVLNPVKVTTDKLDTGLELDGSVYRYTINALEQAPSGGGGGITVTDIWSHATRTLTASSDPSAATIASQVRTELATELGRLDAAVSSVGGGGGASASSVASAVRVELTTELANINTIKSVTDSIFGTVVPPRNTGSGNVWSG